MSRKPKQIDNKLAVAIISVIFVVLIIVVVFLVSGSGGASPENNIDQSVSVNLEDTVATVAAPEPLVDMELTEDQLNRSLYNPGNVSRLLKVMQKAAAGNEVTIAYIGGSITNGDAANPKADKCYARLTTNWWEKTFPMAKINYVNAGIGGTDSYLGVSRVKQDVLDYKPDLVVVEFSVNDGQEWNKESYESLVRDILLSETEPAVISLLLTMQNGYDKSTDHALVAHNYELPIIAYSYLVKDLMNDGSLKWEQIGNKDGVHPNNGGHALIANCLTRFYSKVLAGEITSETGTYAVNESKLTKCRYSNSHLLFADQLKVTSNEGFEKEDMHWYIPGATGFSTKERGSISFEVTGKTIGIFYIGKKDGLSGQWQVIVDGENNNILNANNKDGWGDAIEYIIISKSSEVETHTVQLVPTEDSTGDILYLIGFAVSE